MIDMQAIVVSLALLLLLSPSSQRETFQTFAVKLDETHDRSHWFNLGNFRQAFRSALRSTERQATTPQMGQLHIVD